MRNKLPVLIAWPYRLLSGGAVMLCVALLLPGVASAHVLKLDGAMAGILHINPDDSIPIAGKPTDYVIEFDDSTNQFSLPNCTCTVSVIENGRTVATRPLATSGNKLSENYYTFPEAGHYSLRFTGEPKRPGAFQPFALAYPVQVASDTASASTPLLLWFGAGTAALLVLVASYVTNRRGRDR